MSKLIKKYLIGLVFLLASAVVICISSVNVNASESYKFCKTVYDTSGSYVNVYKSDKASETIISNSYNTVAHRSGVANTELTYSHAETQYFGITIGGTISCSGSVGVDLGYVSTSVTTTVAASLNLSATWTREFGITNTITLNENFKDGLYQYVEYVEIHSYKIEVYKPKYVTYYRTVEEKVGKKTVVTEEAYQVQNGYYLDYVEYVYFAETHPYTNQINVTNGVVRVGDIPSLV